MDKNNDWIKDLKIEDAEEMRGGEAAKSITKLTISVDKRSFIELSSMAIWIVALIIVLTTQDITLLRIWGSLGVINVILNLLTSFIQKSISRD